ncbi:MAG: drug/metabolite transporter (DMT)-like permease [Saprospiraceae bacterium]|jgi:drug/metabolite transporter (DMT)-like permease
MCSAKKSETSAAKLSTSLAGMVAQLCWLVWIPLFLFYCFRPCTTHSSRFNRLFVAAIDGVASAALPEERLRWFHILGGIISMCGALLIVTRGSVSAFVGEHLWGYSAALLCAVIWAAYSVSNRRFNEVPTSTMGGFCLAVCILGVLCHWTFETTIVPQGTQWLAVLDLGLGPVGLAIFVWDYGVKYGHIQLLGVLAYSAPLQSTVLLLLVGEQQWHISILIACGLIISGALIASVDLIRGRNSFS